jgi:hypothetical protein
MRHRAALLLVILLAANQAGLGAQEVTPFVVGIWGQFTAVIPFADFDGSRWRSSWPAPDETEPARRTLDQIPSRWWGPTSFSPTWEVLEPAGRRVPIQITGTGLAALGSSCAANLGLTANIPVERYQYATVLAASRPGAIDPIEALAPGSADWRTISALLPGIYQRHESTVWAAVRARVRPEEVSPRPRPRLDAAFRTRDEGGEFVYFVSSRHLFVRHGEWTLIEGWLWRASATEPFQLVAVEASPADDEGKAHGALMPLGVVRRGSRVFWIGALSSYAYYGLVVLDVRRAGIKPIVQVDYAGC